MSKGERKFNALLRRACNIASEHKKYQDKITTAFEERYGCTHSDVDADYLIDALEYGAGVVTLTDCDREMALCGKLPLTAPGDAATGEE